MVDYKYYKPCDRDTDHSQGGQCFGLLSKNNMKHTYRGGCGCCPKSNDILAMDTVLYNGFGGYRVRFNGSLYWQGDPNDNWDDFPTLRRFEMEARVKKGRWEIVLDNPLRGAVWLRIGEDVWALVETNKGFA